MSSHPSNPKQNITFQSAVMGRPKEAFGQRAIVFFLEQIFSSVEISGICDKMGGREVIYKAKLVS